MAIRSISRLGQRAALFASILVFPVSSQAAQNVTIKAPQTNILSLPKEESPILMEASKGDVYRASSTTKEGWYKVRLPRTVDGKDYGWVSGDSVDPFELREEMSAAGFQSTQIRSRDANRHWVVLSGSYAYTIQYPTQLTSGNDSLFLGHQVTGEIGIRVATTWTLSFHGEYNLINKAQTSNNYQISVIPIGIAVDYTYFHRLPFKVDVGIEGGTTVGSTVTLSGATPATGSLLAPWGGVRLTGRWYPWERFAIHMMISGRYLTWPVTFSDSVERTVDLNQVFARVGVQFEL